MTAVLCTLCTKSRSDPVSPIVKRWLEGSRRFVVTVATTPPKGTTPNQEMSSFAPRFSGYRAVVLDYEGFEFASPVKSFVDYVRNGGGLVVLHAADNAFPGWPEYNEMIGVGGWEGFAPGYSNRTQAAGPKIRWRDGGMVVDSVTPGTAQHPSPHDFLVTNRAPDHPIMKGLPSVWLHANDEIYGNLRGPAKNVTILAMNSVDSIVMLQRGTDWAATRLGDNPGAQRLPIADRTSIR